MGGFQTQVLMDQIKFCFLLKLPGFAVEETKGMRGAGLGVKAMGLEGISMEQ